MKRKTLLKNLALRLGLLFFCMLFYQLSSAQQRVERPLQIQLNFAGTFVKTFGQALSDPEVDKFNAEKWILPGLDIGYHINKTFFLGYSFQPSRIHILEEPWSLSYGTRDAQIAVRYQSGTYHNFNLRISPFNNGLYASASFMLIAASDYEMTAERIGEVLSIGEGTYPADLTAEWIFKRAATFGTGLGYNQVFQNGLSVAFGILVPFISAPFYEDIVLQPLDPNILIEANDEQLAIEKLREETFFYPIQLNLRVGYNF